jgi:glycosyltransferase involved in cell wall biosynthesis
MKGLFVCNWRDISPNAGGVQRCTSEYMRLIAKAGVAMEVKTVDIDARPGTRVARKLQQSPYFRSIRKQDAEDLSRIAPGLDLVLCNQVNLVGGVAEALRNLPAQQRPKLVALSHGSEITDMIHFVGADRALPLSGRGHQSSWRTMGRTLRDEVLSRKHVDGVVCLSESDLPFEHWYGTRRAIAISREVTSAPTNWSPSQDRFGFVGTLDHVPNLEGLVGVLDELRERNSNHLIVRVVSNGSSAGQWLSERYSFVQYLGPLSDPELESEAQSWRAFLNPIFLYSRGASTKLSQALGWGLPIITTPHGRRGYVWTDGGVIEARSAKEFADWMETLLDDEPLKTAKANVDAAARSAPSHDELAGTLRDFFASL